LANKEASKKDMRKSAKRRVKNSQNKSELRTLLKGLGKAIEAGSKEESMTKYREFTKKIDTAVRKKLVKLNTASRHKSRFAKKINKIQAK
jgi:small subunit ribosomal protein S20